MNTNMTVYKNIRHMKIRTGLMLAASGLLIFAGGLLISGAEEPPPVDSTSDRPAVESAPTPQSAEDQPAGDIQERGIHRMMPGPTKPQLGRAPQLLIPGVAPNPPAFGALPGDFTIRTYLKNTPLSARDGRHHSIDAVITVPSVIGPYQRFKLASAQPDFTTIQTAGGYYVNATGGYGDGYDAAQALQTELKSPQNDIALFRVDGPSVEGTMTIKSFSGNFLTALGGGGKANGAFHTDATKANIWEYFWIFKCGELGSGYTYAIKPAGTPSYINILTAIGGGGRTTQAMTAFSGLFDASKFKLIRQGNGSYALQTSNRVNYVTADGGGGIAHATATSDNLHTDATQVQSWEQFKIVEQPNCAYTIQTVSGFYLAVGPGGVISTRISDPNAAPSINYNAKFELIMIGL